MSTHKNLDRICVAIVAGSLVLTTLFINGESLGITKIVDEDAEQNSDSEYFTSKDQDGDWDTSSATVITLTGDGATISGNGAYANDGNVVITNAGYYVVSGTLTDGYISVDAYDSSKVFIQLNGVEINCSDDACIRVDQADKVFLTLAEGSQNILSSGSTYSDEALDDGTDGAIFAHDDLTINGSGSLTVVAEYRHGIAANDDLIITGGNIDVTAAVDGIRGKDSLRIKEASITVDAGDDGIVTSNEEENGYLYIESGTLNITADDDAIHTTGDITVAGGDVTIAAGDDGIHSDSSVYVSDGTILINDCYEGIEALIIDVSGGDITIYPEDDGFNANGGSGSMFGGMGGGQMGGHGMSSDGSTGETAVSGMGGPMGGHGMNSDGMSSDGSTGETAVSGMGGQMGGHGMGGHKGGKGGFSQTTASAATTQTADASGQTTEQTDGTAAQTEQTAGSSDATQTDQTTNSSDVAQTTSDTNTAGGEMQTPPDMGSTGGEMQTPPDMGSTGGEMQTPPDMGSTGGEMQAASDANSADGSTQSTTEAEEEETYINISGGTITIINENGNDADGLDSNGDIKISGGTIYVSLVGSGSNSAVDYASENGGVAEISGGTIIACGASGMAEAFDTSSTQASILYNTSTTTEAGTTLTLEDSDGNVLLSWEVPCSFSSALISCPDMVVGGTYKVLIGDGEEEITLEEVSASYGDAQSSMFGGSMNWGGMKSRSGFGDSSSTGSTDSETAAATEGMQGMPGTPPDMSQMGGTGEMAGQMPPGMSESSQSGSTDAAAGQTPPDMSQSGSEDDSAKDQTDSQTTDQTDSQTTDQATGQAPPDMSQNGGTDAAAGQMSQGGMTGGPMQQEQSQAEEDQSQTTDTTSAAEPVDSEDWAIIGGCSALLLAGIAVVKLYKRH